MGTWQVVSFIYFLIGQAGWFACVLSAARGVPWVGTLLVMALIVMHLWRVQRPFTEFKLVVFVVVLGGAWESALVFFGVLAYPSGMVLPGVAPYWIPALWALFAAQLNTSYRWLEKRVWLAPLLGAIAGPLSFRAGAELGALVFVRPWVAAGALAVGWAILLPIMIAVARRWDGV